MHPESGRMLSHYRLVEKIGEGGMGQVFLAEDTRLERTVALKLLPAALTSDGRKLERFRREAKAVASLNHPNIVTIHSVEQAGESHFLTMELIEGESLDREIPDAGLPLSRVLRIGVDLADALAAAHENGVIHRDLKPANIMITRDGRLKVLDFGLAKLVADAEGPTSSSEQTRTAVQQAPLTGEGTVLGTVPYMSPEQLASRAVDHRTDIFSLGVVLYEAATGRRPFSGTNSAELISAIMRDTPQPVTRLNLGLPRQLARIITMCLEKDPADRFQTVLDVRNELRALRREIASGEIGTGHAAAVSQTAAEQPRGRRRWVWSLLAAVALSVLAGTIWMTRRPGGIDRTKAPPGTARIASIAVLPFDNTGGGPDTEYLSDGITESLINSLAELPDLRVVSRNSVFRYKDRQLDLAEIAGELDVEALVTGRAGQRGETLVVSAELVAVASDAQLWGDQYSRPLSDLLEFQEDIARAIAGQLGQRLSSEQEAKLSKRYTEDTEAYQLYLKGRYQWNRRTNDGIRQALAYFEESIAIDPGFALAWAGVADCYATGAGVYLELQSTEASAKAKAAALRALELDEDLAEAHITLADALYWGHWDWAGSDREFKLGLDLEPGYATGHSWYAEYLSAVGRHDEAIAEMSQAYELDPLAVILPFGLGNTHLRARRFEQAAAWFEKALALAPERQSDQYGLGMSYLGLGQERRAVQSWRDSYSLQGKTELADRLDEAYEKDGMGGVWSFWLQLPPAEDPTGGLEALASAQLGDHDRAFRVIEQAMDRREGWIVHVRNEFLLDPLHSDPRYAELIRKLDFPE